MSIAASPIETEAETMTFEEFMALPDDGMERELIRGIVKVRGLKERGMTIRNRFHAEAEAALAMLLGVWLKGLPTPRGKIASGEVGCRLRGTKDSGVGIDVAYLSAELAVGSPRASTVYDGPPILAVEILSPSDTHEDVVEKVRLYLEVGTVVWLVDPDLKTVTIYRPDSAPSLFSADDHIRDEPYLPGFHAPVSDIFE